MRSAGAGCARLPLLLLLAAGCAAAPPANAPPPPPEESAPALLREGGWSPPEERLAEARLLGDPDPAVREAAEGRLEASDPAARVLLLRAGLRLPDGPAAVACAKRIDWTWIDDRESARCVELLTPFLGGPDTDGWFEEYRSYFGSDDLTDLLPRIPALVARYPDGDWKAILSHLHRVVRAEHLPALGRLALHADPGVAAGAWDCMQTTIPNTARHREAVARVLLRLAADGSEDPEAGGPGYPPLLRAILRGIPWEEEVVRSVTALWVARWMAACRPGPADAPLLLAVLEAIREGSPVEEAALGALGDLDDPASFRFLADRVADPSVEGDARFLVLSSLARRGLGGALAALEAAAAGDATARARWVGIDPAKANRILRTSFRIRGDAMAAAERAARAREEADRLALPWPPGILEGLEEAALEARWSGVDLARLAVLLPSCATRRLAEAAVADLRETPVPDFLLDDGRDDGGPDLRLPDRDGEGAFLEVAAPESFLALAREWAALDPATHSRAREWGIAALLSLGDREPAPLLLQASPDEFPIDLGRMDDPRVRIRLQRLLDRRETGHYREIIEQRALAGDPEAREELHRAFRNGRYRWVDGAEPEAMTDDRDLATIPFWIDELESSCCRNYKAAWMLGWYFDRDARDLAGGLTVPVDLVRRWWEELGPRMRWSRLAGRFVPGPAD